MTEPRMTFVRLVHRHIDGTMHKVANAISALEGGGWRNRSSLAKLIGELKTGNLAWAKAELKKISKRKSDPEELGEAAVKALDILELDVPSVTAYVYVCLELTSPIHSIVEGAIEVAMRDGESRQDLNQDESGEISDCVIHWRNGLVRHVEMKAYDVVLALQFATFDPLAPSRTQGETFRLADTVVR